MTDIQIFSNPQFGEIEAVEQKFADIKSNGWVYALEYGEMIKIGCSSKPSKRYAHLVHNGADYAGLKIGRFALSQPCVNYRELETYLHKVFGSKRKEGTELFAISFEEAVQGLKSLDYDFDFVKADREIESRSKVMIEFAQSVMSNKIAPCDSKTIVQMADEIIAKLSSIIQEQSEMIDKSIEQTNFYQHYSETLEKMIVQMYFGEIDPAKLDYFVNHFILKDAYLN